MEAVKAKNKTFKKLGFTYLETAEIVRFLIEDPPQPFHKNHYPSVS